jgi:hypothetical protein
MTVVVRDVLTQPAAFPLTGDPGTRNLEIHRAAMTLALGV